MNVSTTEINRVHDLREGDYNIQLKIAHHETECYISIRPIAAKLYLTPDLIKEKLLKHRIIVGIDKEKLEKICQMANEGKTVESELIAQGVLPKTGKAAEIRFWIKAFCFHPDFEEDSQGRIDFKKCNLFENVGVGRHVATWEPAILGKNGQAVTGEVIPAEKVANFRIKAGKGIEERENNDFYSTEKGRVILKDDELSVSDEYIIEKDVDYSIGHINFVGFVQVRGEVYDGFNIKAKKGIRVYKNVGACVLHSEGNIEIAGMTGREHDAIIHCGGNLTARYLNNVYVECEGDVCILKDVFNCVIKSKGSISVGGRIVGGECVALCGIEARQVGSEIGVRTHIISGIDYKDVEKIKEWRSKLAEVKSRGSNLDISLERGFFSGILKKWKKLNASQETAIFKMFNMNTEREKAIKGKLANIMESYKDISNPKLNIESLISSSSIICLGNVRMDVKDEVKGPRSLIEFDGKEILVLDKTPLKKTAREISEKIIMSQENK